MNIQKFIYGDSEIEFDLRQGKNMMVNATEMAKIFGKDVFQFTRIDGTKDFLNSCLKPQFCGLLGVNNENDLIISKQKSGTWMHRILALKFAAWLNPDFEVWVYMTIDQLLFDFAYEIEDSISDTIRFAREKESLQNQLAKENPEFMRFLELENKIQASKNRRRNATKNKFRQKTEDLFSNIQEEA